MKMKPLSHFLSITLFFLFHAVTAQQLYFNSGKNYTSYYYSKEVSNPSYLITNSNLIADSGNSYELGILFNQGDTKVDYALGITYNEFNTTYAIDQTAIKYSWQTKYIGIAPRLNFRLYQSSNKNWCDCNNGRLRVDAKLGVNTAAFVYGYENASGINYTLTTHPDYKKIIIQPFTGVDFSYPLSGMSSLHLGYAVSIAAIGRDQGNAFNFINHNFQLGFNLKLQ
jgi:hypothetical protein